MQEYDVALKLLLKESARVTMQELAGCTVEKWLDVELPKVQNPRADLLGETSAGGLVHLELQSGNDAAMPLRMAEYCLGVYRLFDRFPRQVLVYVGEAPMRMDCELRGDDVWFRYRAVDIRELDGERLLESGEVGDNVIAILARLPDQIEGIRKIVGRIAGLEPDERAAALSELLIVAGLRSLEETVEQEARKMPILNSILDNKVLGREYKRGQQEGRQEGRKEGRQEGDLTVLHRLIENRLGGVPDWVEERLANRSTAELEDLIVRFHDAPSIQDLLK
jgi:predicted transposase YdaD